MFGTISLTYTPPNDSPEEFAVSLSFSSEANMKEILKNFERFLRVMEYPLEQGDSLEVVCSAPSASTEIGYTRGDNWSKYSLDSMNFSGCNGR